MSEDLMDYQSLVERAMKSVVRDVLEQIAKDGLPGEHHLYITFQTEHEGVEIADRLVSQYPDEMTIILQHQFWGLEVSEDAFEITLSFSGRNERLFIPFASVTGFADPSVNFGLQFQSANMEMEEADLADDSDYTNTLDDPVKYQIEPPASVELADDDQKTGEVVALDAFRKKKS